MFQVNTRFKLAGVAAAALVLALPAAASADRNFSLRYSNNVNGQITTAANTILQCPLGTPDPLANSGCEGSRAGTNARNNNSYDMQWLDVDDDPSTFDSSSSSLSVPSGARILFAGLYWTGIQKKGEVVKGANGYVGVPQAAPDANAVGTVKLKVPGSSSYSTVTASQVDTGAIANGSGYTAFADVTNQVVGARGGSYTVANVQTATGGNVSAGWTLVVAYADEQEPLRNLAIFDGLKVVSGQAAVDIPLSGFKTPTSGSVSTTMGIIAAEGDAGITGDYLTLNEKTLADAVHPANNTENSTIANRGSQVTTKSPDWRNQLGYDSSLFSADGYLPNGATTAMFRAKTSGDTYAPQAITFATELFSPQVDLTKAVSASSAEPGETLTYTITATNRGSANAESVQLVDAIPAGTTYDASPGVTVTSGTGNASYDATTNTITARLGSGSSSTDPGTLGPGESVTIEFDVEIDTEQALSLAIDNTATLGFVSPDLGLPISKVASATTTVDYPDPGITKAVAGSSGTQYTFDVTVTNQGTLNTVGTVQVTDTLGANATSLVSAGGTGWTCSASPPSTAAFTCQRSDVLAPGTSYPPIQVVANFAAGQPVTNAADITIGGGQPNSDAAQLNDFSDAAAGISPSATLLVNKSALTGTISATTLGGFRINVRNTGPSAATGTVVTDTLPAGLTFVSATPQQGSCSTSPGAGGTTTITCSLGTLAVGASTQVVVRARPTLGIAGTTVTNSVSATSDISSPGNDTANLTIKPIADLSLTKSASAATIDQGRAVTYTVTSINDGPGSATNVQVVDRLPAAIDASTVVATPSSGGSCSRDESVVTCVWSGATASGASRSVSIAANALSSVPAADRDALNQANTFSLTDDPTPANNRASALVKIIPSADLVATASGPGTIVAGGEADLDFSVFNDGPSTSTAVEMTIDIPDGLKPIAAPSGCTIAGQQVTCSIGTLASGATEVRTITVRADSSVVETSKTSTVAVRSNETPDPILGNNSDATPLVAGPIADLEITKTADRETVAPGGTVNFTLKVRNSGPSSSIGATVTDELPAGLTPTSASSSIVAGCTILRQTVTCPAGEIVPNESFEILIVATVGADRAGATLTNTGVLNPGDQTDPNAANNRASASVRVTTDAASSAKLKITTTARPASIKRGKKTTIRATVKNTRRYPANTVRICLTIPSNLKFLKASGSGRRSGSKVCWSRSQLLGRKSAKVSYTARGKTTGTRRLSGTAEAGNAPKVSDPARVKVRSSRPRYTG